MVDVGTNCLTKYEDTVRTGLSELTSCQSFLGAINATEALEKIFIDAPTNPANGVEYSQFEMESVGNHLIVSLFAEESFAIFPIATSQMETGGIIAVQICGLNREIEKATAWRSFKNDAGDIMQELSTTGETPGRPKRPTITLNKLWRASDEDSVTKGEWFYCDFNVGLDSLGEAAG